MNPNLPLTLQSVADYCGLSKTSVSLALRNHPRIAANTRKRIQEAAIEIGYKMSPLVSAHMAMIRGSKTPQFQATIGIVSNWKKSDYFDPKSMPGKHVTGIQKRSKELGYEVDFFTLDEKGMTTRRITSILKSRGISSIIIPTIASSNGTIELPWREFSTVVIGYSMRSPNVHRVCHDSHSSVRNALTFLKAQGFTRIGLAMNKSDDIRVKSLWTGAYYSSILNDTAKLPHLVFVTSDWNREAYSKWLEKDKPDVVLTTEDALVEWTEDLGYKVPDDISIVTVANQDSNVTGYDQMHRLLGEAAVEKVASLLNQNESGHPSNPQTILTQGHWVQGNTLKLAKPDNPPPPSIF